jgi:hypothetical protein
MFGWRASPETVGPSFSCTSPPIDALASLTSVDPTLVKADLSLVQTNYASRRFVDSAEWKSRKSEFPNFVVDTRQKCGLPPVEPSRVQSKDRLPPTAADCVVAAYSNERSALARRLSGPAAEEAARPPEQNLAL